MNMDTHRMAPIRPRMAWLSPMAVGIALVVGAFIVASYIARPSNGKPNPMRDVIAKLEEQIRGDPNSAELRVAVADAYMSDHRVAEALSQYQQALHIDGTREDALYGIGLAYREQGNLDQAGSALQAVIQANVNNPQGALDKRLQGAHFYLGLVLRDQGRYDDAINELRGALSLNRSDADTLYELGKTFALNNNNDDASAALELSVAFVPDFRDAYAEIQKLATTMGDQSKAQYAGAMLEVLDGNAVTALPKLQAAAEQGGGAHYWWALGYALEKTGDKAGAIAAYQKSVAINPGELLAAQSLQQLQGGDTP
jgi:tetratricopeptide (TPR) repeat protein